MSKPRTRQAGLRCHYRINTEETDFYGGKTKSEAKKRQAEISKARGVRGRMYRYCVKPGGPKPNEISKRLNPAVLLMAGVGVVLGIGALVSTRK